MNLKEKCIELEHFETPEWAARAILEKEIFTQQVIDPCCGTGILTVAAKGAGYCCMPFDIHDWGYEGAKREDFLNIDPYWHWIFEDNTVFMNPPFSKACAFVEKSFELGAKKIICFQRFAWWESRKRKEFWEKYPPNRVYICGDRAHCWRHDIPESERKSSTPTAHAWFVWDRESPPGTLLGHIWRDE